MSDDYWESAYESGEFKHLEFSYPSPELIALVAAKVPRRNAVVLDVGCGGGTDAIFMAQSGFRVIAEKRAKKAYSKVYWVRANVLRLPIDDVSIDFVTDRGLFHLIEDHDRPKYAAELFRVLKNRGHVLIRDASTESAPNRFNLIITESIDRYFPASKFQRGPVLPIPLFSVEGSMDARIVMLQKTGY
jgi:ubiquinone/menaquinone biosynthesis C-methylase UbiE